MIESLKTKLNHPGFRRYLNNTSWMFFGRIGVMAISFVVVAFVARYLGPENFGSLSYVISLIGIFAFLANLGIDSVLYREIAMHPEKENELLGSSFFLKFVGAFLVMIALAVTLPFLGNSRHLNILTVIAALSFFFQTFNVIILYFQAKVLSKNNTISSLLVTAVLSLLKIGFIWLGFGIYYFVWILVLEQILYALILVWFYKREGKSVRDWRLDRQLAKGMWLESIPLMFSTAFMLIYNRIDQVMIKRMLDISAVGYYDVAVRISEFWYFIPMLIVTSMLPAVINAKKIDLAMYRRRLWRLSFIVIGVSVLSAVLVFIFSKFLVMSFFGVQYQEAIPVIRIYVWGGVGMTIGVLANNYLIIEKRTTLSFFANLSGAVANIALNFYLIPRQGMIGAAIATLISYYVMLAIILLARYVTKFQNRHKEVA